MPGIDTDTAALGLDDLPARLAALTSLATERLEAQAADPAKLTPEQIVRTVGVIARTASALVFCVERLARLRARTAAAAISGGTDAMEEADMDDADDAGAWRPGLEDDTAKAARLERDLRALARNLHIPGADGGGSDGAGCADPRGAARQLVGAGAGAPAAA